MIVSAVLWLWVRNATEAIKRADRAELIAQLERSIAERDRAIILQKKQLEHSIRQVEYLLEQIANGNLDARLALNENNVLWSIVGKLNNLLSRYKQSLRVQRELQGVLPRVEKAVWMEKQHQRLVATIQNLQRELQRAHSERRSLHVASLQRGTLLDPLIRDLNGKYISEVPPRETFKLNSTLV